MASGIRVVHAEPESFPPAGLSPEWDLLSAGVFEQDVALVNRALRLAGAPRSVCAVAAGVREFARSTAEPEGVFGIAQWFPGDEHEVLHGPSEENFLRAYVTVGGGVADYPAAQAAAGAVIAAHCIRTAGSTSRDDLWAAAASLDTSTLFGGFRIDPHNGTQVKHQTVLVRWEGGDLVPVSGSAIREES
jgi:hypothetical protein